MRRPLIGDLLAAARVLAMQPPARQVALMDRMIEQAHAAHRYMRRMGYPHSRWGDGSLMARALAEPAPVKSGHRGHDFCSFAALSVAAARLAAFRNRRV